MIGGIGNLRAPGFYFPVEIRADISASLAANLAGKSPVCLPMAVRPEGADH
jgi:hypothetical protein